MRRRTLLWPPFSLFSPLCAWPLSVRPQGHSACAASPSFSLCIWLSVESLPHWSLTVFLCCWPLPGNPGGGHAVQMLTLGPCGSLWLTVVDDSTLFFDNSPVTIRAAGYPATPRDGSCNETPPASSVRPSVLPPGGGMGQVGDLRASCSFLRSPFGATSPFFCGHRHPLHTAEGPCLRRFEPFFLLSLVNLPFPATQGSIGRLSAKWWVRGPLTPRPCHPQGGGPPAETHPALPILILFFSVFTPSPSCRI